MSSEAMAWAKQCSEAGPVPQLVLILMADWADHENKAWPGIKKLANLTGRSERTIIRAIKRLEDFGLITKSARTAWCALDNPACLAKGPHKHRTSNMYHLNVGAVIVAATDKPNDLMPSVISDKMSLMTETAESCDISISDKMSHMGSISDISGRSIVTPVSPVCNSDTPDAYSPDPTPPALNADPVRSENQDFLSEHGAANADAAKSRGQLAAEMLAAGENPACMVANGLWDTRQLADALTWAASHIDVPQVAKLHSKSSGNGAGHTENGLDNDLNALIGACLPQWMQSMDTTGARKVAAMLNERIEAGWTPAQIRSVMGEMPPNGTKRMSGLVAYRLTNNAAPSDAPAARQSAAQQAREATIEAARTAQAAAIAAQQEAIKTPEERERERAAARMWERMRASHPEASNGELALLIQEAMSEQRSMKVG